MSDITVGSIKRQMELARLEGRGEALPGLSAHDMELVEKRMRAFKEATDALILAMYKIEVTFGEARSREHPFVGFISIWLSGNRMHGDGDEKIYECGKCSALIRPDALDGDAAVCHHCGWVGASADLCGERICKLTEQNWAKAIYNAWRRVGGDADVWLKYHPKDLHKARTRATRAVGAGGMGLIKAREARQKLRYPLKNILIDTAGGATLEKRFLALIRA